MSLGLETVEAQLKAVEKLFSKNIVLEEIVNHEEIDVILPEARLNALMKEASYRTEKYLRKRMPADVEGARERVGSRALFRIGLDEIVSWVCGFKGVSDGPLYDYKRFSYSVSRALKTSPLPTWPSKIDQEIRAWKVGHEVDDALIKAVALATAKWFYKYYMR